jgi:hypothetical protein
MVEENSIKNIVLRINNLRNSNSINYLLNRNLLIEECVNVTNANILEVYNYIFTNFNHEDRRQLIFTFMSNNSCFVPEIVCTKLVDYYNISNDPMDLIGLAFAKLENNNFYNNLINLHSEFVDVCLCKNNYISKPFILKIVNRYVEKGELHLFAIECLISPYFNDEEMLELISNIKITSFVGQILASRNWKTETLWKLEEKFRFFPDVTKNIQSQPNYSKIASIILKFFNK